MEVGGAGLRNRWLRAGDGVLCGSSWPLLPPDTLHLQSRVWEGVKFLQELSSRQLNSQSPKDTALFFQECNAQLRQGPPVMLLEETNQLMESWNMEGGRGLREPLQPALVA